MKKLLIVAALCLGGFISFSHAGQYIEAQGGLVANSWGLRAGRTYDHLDASVGYLRSERYDVDLHTIGGEWYYTMPIKQFTAKVGGGIGFTIPNFPDGGETGDNGHSWTLGAGVEYPLGEHWAIEGMARGFFFKTDTKKVTYGTITETLSTGQPVEVEEVHYEYAPRQFNSLIIGLAVRYFF